MVVSGCGRARDGEERTGDGKVTKESVRVWGLEQLLEVDGGILSANDWGHVEMLILVKTARVQQGLFVLSDVLQRLLARRTRYLDSFRDRTHCERSEITQELTRVLIKVKINIPVVRLP